MATGGVAAINVCGLKECLVEIKSNDSYISCKGLCNRTFHLSCTDIKRTEAAFIAKESVKWFCEECEVVLFAGGSLFSMLKMQNTMLINMREQITVLSSNVNCLNKQIETLKSDKVEKTLQGHVEPKNIGNKKNVNEKRKEILPTKNITAEKLKTAIDQVTVREQKTYADMVNTNKNENEFTLISRRRRNRRTETIGTGAGDTKFIGIAKKAWLYIGRVNKTTKKEDVMEYLNKKFPTTTFEIEDLNSKGMFASFKIGFDFNCLDEVNKPESWPKEVCIRRFEFFRRSNARAGEHIEIP